MTQATFLFPSVKTLTGQYYDSGQSEFSGLTFGSGSAASMRQGPVPFEAGRDGGEGTAWSCTDTALRTAGVGDVNELLFVVQKNPAAYTTMYWGVRMATDFTVGNPPNGSVYAVVGSAFGVALRRKTVAGSDGELGAINLASAGKDRWPLCVRLRASGSAPTVCQLKVWPAEDPEPEAWDLTYNDSNVNPTGIPWVWRYNSGWPGTMSHFSMGVGEAAPNLYGTISGNVFEAPDTGVARTVRAVAREDPRLVFETESEEDGSYVLPVLNGFTYTVYAMDDDLNAGIKDRLSPV